MEATGIDWVAAAERGGVSLICLALIYAFFKVGATAFKLFMEQWQNSTDAVNKNTEAFGELSKVFERSNEREIEFQTHVRRKLEEQEEREKSAFRQVDELHRKLL